jgi:hypothetical protein
MKRPARSKRRTGIIQCDRGEYRGVMQRESESLGHVHYEYQVS